MFATQAAAQYFAMPGAALASLESVVAVVALAVAGSADPAAVKYASVVAGDVAAFAAMATMAATPTAVAAAVAAFAAVAMMAATPGC